MLAIPHLQNHAQIHHLLAHVVRHADVPDVGIGIGNRHGDAGHGTHTVVDGHRHRSGKAAFHVVGPFHGHKALAVACLEPLGHIAVGRVHNQAFSASQIADDLVPGQRMAAGGILDRRFFAAVQGNGRFVVLLVLAVAFHGHEHGIGTFPHFGHERRELLGNHAGDALAVANVGKQVIEGLVVGKAQQLFPDAAMCIVVGRELLHALGPVGLGEQPSAQHLGFGLGLDLEMVADARARPRRAHEAQPCRLGARVGIGHHLDDISAVQFGTQGSRLVVDDSRDSLIPHVTVNGIGKIDHRRSPRQRHDAVLGCEDKHILGKEVEPHMVEKLVRIQCLLLDVEQALEPVGWLGVLAVCRGLQGLFVLAFVEPVGSHPRFCYLVHRVGTHLELDVDAGRAHQRRVQGLIAVVLGNGNEILEPLGHWLVERMQNAECDVAVGIGRHDDAETVDVVQVGKALPFGIHLAVDRIDGLLACADAGMQPGCRKGILDVLLNFLHKVAPAAAGTFDGLHQRLVAPRMQVFEGQILQLAVGTIQTQSVGDGSVDLERLCGNALLCLRLHVGERAHVVRAVGQLHQDDAYIVGHGQQHLAEGLCLIFLAGAELELVELGQAVDQVCHMGTELFRELGLGDPRIFHGVMEQGSHESLCVELPLGTLCSDRDRMGDVRFAALAHLPQVRAVRQLVGLAHARYVFWTQIVQFGEQRRKTGGGSIFGGGIDHGGNSARRPDYPMQRFGAYVRNLNLNSACSTGLSHAGVRAQGRQAAWIR